MLSSSSYFLKQLKVYPLFSIDKDGEEESVYNSGESICELRRAAYRQFFYIVLFRFVAVGQEWCLFQDLP